MKFGPYLNCSRLARCLGAVMLAAIGGLGVLTAAQVVATDTSADGHKAAEKVFGDIYGADESAALRSREPDDNLALAQKIVTDSGSAGLEPALVEVMRDRAINLLTALRTVAGYQQAISLRQDEMALPGADRETVQNKIVDLVAAAAKLAPAGAEQMAAERRVMLALAELAEIQLKKRAFSDAIRTLDRIRGIVNRYDPNAGAQISARTRLLQPLTQRETRLAKLKKDFTAKPDDKAVAAEIAKVLVLDWGDIMATAPYLPIADPTDLTGLTEMLAFEEAGENYAGQSPEVLRVLADGYERWAGDRQTQKFAQVQLLRRAVQVHSELAARASGMDSLRAKRALSDAEDKLAVLVKDQAELVNAISGPLVLDGSIYLSRIAGFDFAEIKTIDAPAGTPRLEIQQMLQLNNGAFCAFSNSQGPGIPPNQQGWRAVVATDTAAGWTACPAILSSPAQRVAMFPDVDGKSFWVWVNRQNKIALSRWYYDAVRKDVVKMPGDFNGTLPRNYGDERGMTLGADGSLLVTSGEVYQNNQRWMIKPRLLKYDMRKFGDPVMDIPVGVDTDSWRQRPIPMMIGGIWHLYHQDGNRMDEMRWQKLVDNKLVELYRFQSQGNIQQLLPGKGADVHFVWDHNGRYYLCTWNGRAMSEEKYFVSWQNGMQRTWVNVYAFGDQLAALVIRSAGGPQDPNNKFQVATLFRSQGNWSAEKPVPGSDAWPKTYNIWDPPGFRGVYNSMLLPMLLGDRDLKAVANFKISP